jgi:hypothetical protein
MMINTIKLSIKKHLKSHCLLIRHFVYRIMISSIAGHIVPSHHFAFYQEIVRFGASWTSQNSGQCSYQLRIWFVQWYNVYIFIGTFWLDEVGMELKHYGSQRKEADGKSTLTIYFPWSLFSALFGTVHNCLYHIESLMQTRSLRDA